MGEGQFLTSKAEVVILSFFFFSLPIPAEGLSGYKIFCTRENMEPRGNPTGVDHSPGSFSLEGHLYLYVAWSVPVWYCNTIIIETDSRSVMFCLISSFFLPTE